MNRTLLLIANMIDQTKYSITNGVLSTFLDYQHTPRHYTCVNIQVEWYIKVVDKMSRQSSKYTKENYQHISYSLHIVYDPASVAITRWSPSLITDKSSIKKPSFVKIFVGWIPKFWYPKFSSSGRDPGRSTSFPVASPVSGQLMVTRAQLWDIAWLKEGEYKTPPPPPPAQ